MSTLDARLDNILRAVKRKVDINLDDEKMTSNELASFIQYRSKKVQDGLAKLIEGHITPKAYSKHLLEIAELAITAAMRVPE